MRSSSRSSRLYGSSDLRSPRTIRPTSRFFGSGSAAFTLNGNEFTNTLFGASSGAFDDRLFGFAGNDSFYGYGGNDLLHGGSGDDTLNGGAGTDNLNGSTGIDIARGGAGDPARPPVDGTRQARRGAAVGGKRRNIDFEIANRAHIARAKAGEPGRITIRLGEAERDLREHRAGETGEAPPAAK